MSLQKWYPGAMRIETVEEVVSQYLKNLGFKKENTLLIDSTCSSKVCQGTSKKKLMDYMQKTWGTKKQLSGLGGLPTVGKTGWGILSSRCKDDGNIILMFSSHIGISETGQIGSLSDG